MALSYESGLTCTVKTFFMFRGVCGSGEGEGDKGKKEGTWGTEDACVFDARGEE